MKKFSKKKKTVPISDLCSDLPEQFCKYLEHSKSLNFEEEPNYDYLSGLFTEILCTLGPGPDFEWINNPKSAFSESLCKKANTSLLLNNNNISKNSPVNNNESSHIKEDIHNNSIFKKCDLDDKMDMSIDIHREDKKVDKVEKIDKIKKIEAKKTIEQVEDNIEIQKEIPSPIKKEKKEKGLCDCIIN